MFRYKKLALIDKLVIIHFFIKHLNLPNFGVSKTKRILMDDNRSNTILRKPSG